MDDLRARASLLRGDSGFLRLFETSGPQRAGLIKSALDEYLDAIHRYQLVLLTYYVEDRQRSMLPAGLTPDSAAQKLTPQQVAELVEKLHQDVKRMGPQAAHSDDWDEYMRYIRRAEARVKTLQAAAATAVTGVN
jgi:hypothetical protein